MRIIVKEDSLYDPNDAIEIFLKHIKFERTIDIPVEQAFSLVLAEDIKSPIDYPPFSRSNVDGYAIKSSCTPGVLEIVGKIKIGEHKNIHLNECKAVEVDTGSMIPLGSDAVVKVEEVEVKDNKVVIPKKVSFGYNVGWIGSDISKGTYVARKGKRLSHEEIALLASLGIDRVKVYDKLKIYIITTGDELIQPGKTLIEGKIYESNSYYLMSRLKEGFEVVDKVWLNDDLDKIKNEILKATEIADVVILTGGTSAGERDFVHKAILELGKIVVHGIKIKPGKPTILGLVKNKPVIGLPGNVVSSIVVFDNIVLKILENIYPARKEQLGLGKIKAKIVSHLRADRNRDTLFPVYIFKGLDNHYYSLPIKFDSYMVGTFALSEGYVMLKAGTEIEEGKEVEVNVKKYDDSLTVIGEEEKWLLDLDAKTILLGSFPALKAIEYKFGDIAIVSSLYGDVDEYDKIIKREILSNGNGEEIGYDDWIGMSKLIRNPVVKLKSPSSVYSLLGRAKVFAPGSYIKGEKVSEEHLYLVGITERGKKFISNLNI